MPDPTEIARSLTPAQRKALLWLRKNGIGKTVRDATMETTLRELRAIDLNAGRRLYSGRGWTYCLTPLGIEVRKVLEGGNG